MKKNILKNYIGKMRLELKYIINLNEAEKLYGVLKKFFEIEKNSEQVKPYENINIYFDDKNLKYYNEKKEGVSIRNKIRLRFSKNIGENEYSRKQIEIKKRRGFDATKDIYKIEKFENHIISNLNNFLFEKHQLLIKNSLFPVSGVRYTRTSLFSEIIPGVRITFDTSVKCFNDFYNIDKQNLFFYILPPRNCLLELKISRSFPIFLKKIIMEFQLQQITYSKYAKSLEKIYEKNYKSFY